MALFGPAPLIVLMQDKNIMMSDNAAFCSHVSACEWFGTNAANNNGH
jgi:hypothetical protein